MGNLTLPIKLLLALVLGALIGLEREASADDKSDTEDKPTPDKHTQNKPIPEEKSTENNNETQATQPHGDMWGLRTYSLISLLGAIAGLLYLFDNLLLSTVITVAFFILIFLYYAIGGWIIKSMGLTTELGGIFSFLIGYFITSEIFPTQLVIAIAVVLTLILSIKDKSRRFILGVKRTEIDAFISFAIVALVILPFLPNRAFHLTDISAIKTMLQAYGGNTNFFEQLEIINPFKLWFIVALITGIDIFGYLLSKLAGKKRGLILTSSIGGFISSTSTTQSLAQQSKHQTNSNELVAAAIFANLTSFLQVFILIVPLNSAWLVSITPVMLTIVLSALLVGLYFLYSKNPQEINLLSTEEEEKSIKKDTIISLKPALRFAIILVLIRSITKTSLVLFGNSGFLLTSIIASFTGIDAVVINLSELAGNGITTKMALVTLLAVNATNLFSKAGYAFMQADRKFAVKFTLSMVIIVTSSFVGYLFFGT